MNTRGGFTLLEMLIVIAIAGILMGFGLVALRQVQKNGEESAFITNFTLSVKSAAAYASSRRSTVVLTRSGDRVTFVDANNQNVEDNQGIVIPKSITTNIPDGASLVFGSNGTVTQRTLPQPLTVTAADRLWSIQISTIGDTRVIESGR